MSQHAETVFSKEYVLNLWNVNHPGVPPLSKWLENPKSILRNYTMELKPEPKYKNVQQRGRRGGVRSTILVHEGGENEPNICGTGDAKTPKEAEKIAALDAVLQLASAGYIKGPGNMRAVRAPGGSKATGAQQSTNAASSAPSAQATGAAGPTIDPATAKSFVEKYCAHYQFGVPRTESYTDRRSGMWIARLYISGRLMGLAQERLKKSALGSAYTSAADHIRNHDPVFYEAFLSEMATNAKDLPFVKVEAHGALEDALTHAAEAVIQTELYQKALAENARAAEAKEARNQAAKNAAENGGDAMDVDGGEFATGGSTSGASLSLGSYSLGPSPDGAVSGGAEAQSTRETSHKRALDSEDDSEHPHKLRPGERGVAKGGEAPTSGNGVEEEGEGVVPTPNLVGDQFAPPRYVPSRFARQEMEARQRELEALLTQYENSPATQRMRDQRASLPVVKASEDVLRAVRENPVVVVVAATGSGKTTQIPQLLLDEATRNGKGGETNIVCTQPRRIAAVSVAQRMASERHERVGESVGYHVRFDAKPPRENGSISLCTVGYFLRRLQLELSDTGSRLLERTSHIVVDEVHERTVDIDLLLFVLRRLWHQRRLAGLPAPKIILMSATIDPTQFTSYFADPATGAPAPVLEVEGRSFPVKKHFLDDFLPDLQAETRRAPYNAGMWVFDDKEVRQYIDRELGRGNGPATNRGRDTSATSRGYNPRQDLTAEEFYAPRKDPRQLDYGDWGNVGKGWGGAGSQAPSTAASRLPSGAPSTAPSRLPSGTATPVTPGTETPSHSLASEIDPLPLPIPLIALIIAYILRTSVEGHILVFLPGWDEMTKTREILDPRGAPLLGVDFRDPSLEVHMLHSTVPLPEQQRVFEPAAGARRVILATNIAETSVTIPDVVYVVDSGKCKENRFDPVLRVTQLVSAWTGSSNLLQRAGRAGRHRAGEYYGLASNARFASLAVHQTVEMLRTNLVSTCMHVIALRLPGLSVLDVLSAAIQPPEAARIATAMDSLVQIGAIDANEELTPLGEVLLHLPTDSHLAKFCLLGALCRCLEPTLTLAAIFSTRDPFVAPPSMRQYVMRAKEQWSDGAFKSDQLATLNAFNAWFALYSRGERARADQFVDDNFLSRPTLLQIDEVRRHLLDSLQTSGILDLFQARLAFAGGGVGAYGAPAAGGESLHDYLNANRENLALLSALVGAALLPNFAVRTSASKLKTAADKVCHMHQSSLNAVSGKAKMSADDLARFVYSFTEKQKTGKSAESGQVFLKGTTQIGPLGYLFFGAAKTTKTPAGFLCDNWLFVRVSPRALYPVDQLKYALDQCFLHMFREFDDNINAKRHRKRGGDRGAATSRALSTPLAELRDFEHVANAVADILDIANPSRRSNSDEPFVSFASTPGANDIQARGGRNFGRGGGRWGGSGGRGGRRF